MNILTNLLKLLFFITPVIWIGCNSNQEDPLLPPDFENGVFITNEGNFLSGNGSLSFFDFEAGKVYNNVYSLANADKNLGDVVQSIHLGSDRAFVVVNNSHKVEALGLDDMVEHYTIKDVSLPRYMTSTGNKGYISEWVSFEDVGRISIVDLGTGEVTNTIETDYGAEGVIIAENKLFVSNNFSTTVSVIDLNTESVIKTIDVGSSPGAMVKEADGNIWLVCGGGYDQEYMPLGDGKLIKIDPVAMSTVSEIDLGMNVQPKVASDPGGDHIYYFSGNSVYSVNVNATASPTTPFIEEDEVIGFYGIGVDESGMIYLSYAKGFEESGEVFVYDSDGSFQKHFIAGIGPNDFAFN